MIKSKLIVFLHLSIAASLSLTGILFPRIVVAQDSQKLILESCQKRDDALNHLEFVWMIHDSVARTFNGTEADRQKIYSINDSQAEWINNNNAKNGYTDPKAIAYNMKVFRDISLRETMNGELHSDWKLIGSRNPNIVRLNGSRIDPESKNFAKMKEYFGQDWNLCYDDERYTSDKSPIQLRSPIMIGAKGEPIFFNVDARDYLRHSPYETAMSIGVNPLKIFGYDWKLVSSIGDLVRFHKEYVFQGRNSADINLTLSTGKDYAPILFEVQMPGVQMTLTANSFHKRKGYAICDKFTIVEKHDRITMTQIWKLQTIVESKPIEIEMPSKNQTVDNHVSDLRLMTVGELFGDLEKALSITNVDHRVEYTWTGRVPTLDELREMQKKSKKRTIGSGPTNNYLSFIPGVLLIATGVFLKLRKSRKEKDATPPTAKK